MREFVLPAPLRGSARRARAFAVALALADGAALALPSDAAAQREDILRHFPSVDRVLEEITGTDEMETAARRAGAFHQLDKLVIALAGPQREFGPWSATERSLIGGYRNAYRAVIQPMDQKHSGATRPQWSQAHSHFSQDPAYLNELITRFFPPAGQAELQQVLATQSVSQAGARGRQQAERDDARERAERPPPEPEGPGLGTLLVGTIFTMLLTVVPILLIGWWLLRGRVRRWGDVRRGNREAMKAFAGADAQAREAAIIDAFESQDFTFRFTGINHTRPHRMQFTLARNIKSFRRGDLEALRLAYLAYNRRLIDEERFHWYRFSAIYGAGKTDPSEYKFLGLFGGMKAGQGAIEAARASVAAYAAENGGADAEAQALSTLHRLVAEHPGDTLFAEMQRRFVDGAYWLMAGDLTRNAVFAPSLSPYSLSFGVLDGTRTELTYAGDGSIFTVAPPGAGKTQCNVIPNLLRWPGAAVVLDVKGEIYEATSRWRREHVGPVIRFSPLDPANSARYNPLSAVRRDALFLWEDARYLAEMMIVPGGSKEPFWENRAKDVLTAVIADICFWNAPDARPMSKLLSVINRNGWTEFVDRLRKNPEMSVLRDEGASLASTEPKTLDGILQTAKSSLGVWAGERIARVTAASDWSPLDLRSGRNPTLYICVRPNELDTYMSLLRVVIAQHILTLTAELPAEGSAPILFMLDELPRLRHMPPVEVGIELGRQYRLRLWMFAQSVGQIRTAYPNADGMMGACTVRSYMNPSLHDGTAKLVAEQIGYRSGEEHGGKDASAGADQLIVQPTELAGPLYKDLQIVLGLGSKPAKVRKVFAYNTPELASRMLAPGVEARGELGLPRRGGAMPEATA